MTDQASAAERSEGDAMMQEHKCTCHCGGSMFYRHLHADNCPLAVHGEEAPKSKEYDAAYAAGRVAGLREGVNAVERALLCTGRGVFSDGVKAGCKYIRDELTNQIEQAAQG